MNDEMEDVLVLTDEAGTYYAIPRDVLEQYKATGEQKAELEAALGDDVSGFSMSNYYEVQQNAAYHQADLLREAEQSRLANLAQSRNEDDAETEPAPRGVGFIGAFIRQVRRSRPAQANP